MRAFAAGLLAIVFAACGTSVAHADWVAFSSKDYGFSASFPKTPVVTTDKHLTTVAGKDYMFETHQFSAKDANGTVCIVVHSLATWPVVVDEQLTANRDAMASGVGAAVTTSKRTSLTRGATAVPALQFDAAGADLAFRTLEVIDGQTAYEVIGGIPIANGNDADLDRCIKSFALTPAK